MTLLVKFGKQMELVISQLDVTVVNRSFKNGLANTAMALGIRLVLIQMPVDVLPLVCQLLTESLFDYVLGGRSLSLG